MQKISVVQEFPHRDFALSKFSGDQPDKDGNKNIGAAYMAYVAQILNTAKDEGCAVVLASQTQSLMSTDAKADLLGRLLELDAVQIKTDKIRTSMGKVRSELEAEAKRQEKRDAHAAKVISISQRFAARHVVLQMERIMKPHGSNWEKALNAIIANQRELYFGQAYQRGEQARDMISKVGVAYTLPQFSLLLSVLEYIYAHVEDWFTRSNPDGTTELYDNATPPITEAEWLLSIK
jgi:negative regulator of replication initiation